MIVSKIIGGLGNQMFQYALGSTLAARRGALFALDRRDFAHYRTHAYGLQHFVLSAPDAPQSILPRRRGRLHRLLGRLTDSRPLKVVTESGMAFNPAILDLPDNVYLDGYWQSERYFADAAEAIRAAFAIKTAPSPENRRWLDQIGQCPAVSVHVRRGDYVSNASANAVHGTCGLDYYERAISTMRQQLGTDPVFFAFSDDPEWTRQSLPFGGCQHHVIDNNDASTNYEDLRLMASCRHHIVANSSFSWWGAWLNPSPDKVVIAPTRWFRAESFNDRDLVPQGWIRL